MSKCLIALVFALVSAFPVQPQVRNINQVPALTLQELANKADQIFIGRVKSVKMWASPDTQRYDLVEVTVRIESRDDFLKGAYSTDVTYHGERDSLNVKIGNQVLVFLGKRNPNNTALPLGLDRGHFSINYVGNQTTAESAASNTGLSHPPLFGDGTKPIPLSILREEIHKLLVSKN